MLDQDSEVRGKIPADLLKKYDVIKEKRTGQAVVSVWKEICAGCHMNIPPQMYNELQRYEKVVTCPNCNRIIYWEDLQHLCSDGASRGNPGPYDRSGGGPGEGKEQDGR
jgi:predicted  nucleic acid-binding Zn-ribbon protein